VDHELVRADIMATLCVVDGEQAMLLVDMHSDAVVVGAPDKRWATGCN
jgi:hypothetical protein